MLMNLHRTRPTRRLSYSFGALSFCAIALGCGASPEADSTPQVVRAGLSYCPDTKMCTTNKDAVVESASKTKLILTEAKDILSLGAAIYSKSPGSIGSSLFQFVQDNFLSSSSPDLEGDINCLSNQLQCVAQGLDWHVTDLNWETNSYTPVTTALQHLGQFGPGPGYDVDSAMGTFNSGLLGMFSRYYSPPATDGDGNWKKTVRNATPDLTQNGEVFDWQGGLTRFTSLIPARLAIIASMDPHFQTDGLYKEEIDGATGYRVTLQSWLKKMQAGIHCDANDLTGDGRSLRTDSGQYWRSDIACADVNSGLSAEATYQMNASGCNTCSGGYCFTDYSCLQTQLGYATMELVEDYTLKRQVEAQMPIFEVQSMIDSLYQTMHPAPDLAEAQGRIPVGANHALCLDVQGGNSASGTPVWVWGCNGTGAQQWSYNRSSQTITNTAFGKCLQVRPGTHTLDRWLGGGTVDSNAPGATAEISDCISPVPPNQEWSFDPEKGLIRSGFGTVLVISGSTVQSGDAVLLGDENDTDPSKLPFQTWYADRHFSGDNNMDGLADIRLTGAAWGTIPIAINQGGGIFNGDAWPVSDTNFTDIWATSPNVKALAGDFDGDGRADVALTGGQGWGTIPIAFADASSNSFRVTNIWADDSAYTQFGSWASSPNVWPVSGDFNGDGRTDIALTGGAGWWTIPVAFSKSDGSFHVTDQSVDTTFNSYAIQPGARPVAGDFNGDGRSDIAIVGGTQANEIAVALSNGDGNFTIHVEAVTAGDTNFAAYATQPGVQVVSGDFNGDGKGDIALTGGSGWWTIPVAFSTNGAFSVVNADIASGDGNFPYYAPAQGVKAISGDFNKDGKSDIALTGGAGWWTIPVAFSNGDGTFSPTNNATQGASFADRAATQGVSATGGGY